MSADGIVPKKTRLDMGKRRSISDDILSKALQINSDKPELPDSSSTRPSDQNYVAQANGHEKDKKKRFGKLRRMMGIKK